MTGCTKISPGCKFCYAERLAARLERMGNPRYVNGFDLTLHADQFELPLQWKRPQPRVRQLHERSLSCGRPGHVHRIGVPDDGAGTLAFLPGAHEAGRTVTADRAKARMAEERVDGRLASRTPITSRGSTISGRFRRRRTISLTRTATRAASASESETHRLGDRRGRKRAALSKAGSGMDPRPPRSMRSGKRAVLLQAMGRLSLEVWRSNA